MSEENKVEAVQNEVTQSEVSQEESMDNVSILKRGDIVTGTIIKVDADQVYVNVGYKYDGIIPLKELASVNVEQASDLVTVGQDITVKVTRIDDRKEVLELSKRAIDNEKAWDKLQADLDNKTVLEAVVAEVVKGGLVVDVGARGFVPASMVERTFVEDFSGYKGRTLRLLVKEIDREKNRVILSQKDVLESEHESKKQQLLASLEVGQQFTGTVQRLTNFGAFVDIGGIDGLVHVSELSWAHVGTPADVVKVGDTLSVKIIKLDRENERISLSVKATQPGPWELAAQQFNIGDVITGTVKRLTTFGAFVEVAPGVEGLVHISQIAHRHIGTPQEVLEVGQEVQVKVLDLLAHEKRISLSIKETQEAPEPVAEEVSEPKPRTERKSAPRRERAEESTPIAAEYQKGAMNNNLGDLFGDALKKLK